MMAAPNAITVAQRSRKTGVSSQTLYNWRDRSPRSLYFSGCSPGRAIVGIDCLPLIGQNGALHCITMQLPRGVRAV